MRKHSTESSVSQGARLRQPTAVGTVKAKAPGSRLSHALLGDGQFFPFCAVIKTSNFLPCALWDFSCVCAVGSAGRWGHPGHSGRRARPLTRTRGRGPARSLSQEGRCEFFILSLNPPMFSTSGLSDFDKNSCSDPRHLPSALDKAPSFRGPPRPCLTPPASPTSPLSSHRPPAGLPLSSGPLRLEGPSPPSSWPLPL